MATCYVCNKARDSCGSRFFLIVGDYPVDATWVRDVEESEGFTQMSMASYEIKAVIAASRPTAVLATTTKLTKARRFISARVTQRK
jgi:hypothetical protein